MLLFQWHRLATRSHGPFLNASSVRYSTAVVRQEDSSSGHSSNASTTKIVFTSAPAKNSRTLGTSLFSQRGIPSASHDVPERNSRFHAYLGLQKKCQRLVKHGKSLNGSVEYLIEVFFETGAELDCGRVHRDR